MWIAFLVPVVIYSIKGLHFYFPFIPNINLDIQLQGYLAALDKPWNSVNPFWIKIFFSVIGFTYLIPIDLSFSLWFFYLFFQLQIVVGSMMGLPMPIFPNGNLKAFQVYQTAGGVFIFAVLLFWAMRADLKKMFSNLFKKKTAPEDEKELYGTRLAIICLFAGFFFICFWAMAAGVKFWAIAFFSIIFFLTVVVTTRMVAEGGLFSIHHDFLPLELMFPFVGSASMGAASIPTLAAFNQIFGREFRVLLMPFILNNFKMADEAKMKKRSLVIPMALSVVVIIVVSYVTILNLMYRYGGVNLIPWFTNILPNSFVWSRATLYLTSPVSPNFKDVLTMIIGAGATFFLFAMRRIFLWWPFHPIGYLMAGGYAMHHIWFSTFLGWLVKVVILKIGGIKIYQKLMPAFLGLILGEFVVIGAWALVDLIAGTRGNFLLWM